MPWETWRIIIIYTLASTLAVLLCDWWVNRARFGIKKGGWEDTYNNLKEQRRRRKLPLHEQEEIIKKELSEKRKLEARLERERLRDQKLAREWWAERAREEESTKKAQLLSDLLAQQQRKKIKNEQEAAQEEKEALEKEEQEEKEALEKEKQEKEAQVKDNESLPKPKE